MYSDEGQPTFAACQLACKHLIDRHAAEMLVEKLQSVGMPLLL